MRKLYFLYIVWNIASISLSLGQIPGSQLFDNSKIHEVKVVSFFENLHDTLESNYILSFGMNQIQTRDIPYARAKLIVDGTILDTLAIRYKGFNSWWHSVKKPIKIDINKYKSDQKYDGLTKFNLHNGSGDPSFLRETINYKILRLLGAKAPRTSYAKVFIDTAYIGFYRIVEQVDNTFLDINFGNHNGNLYKQQGKGTAGFSLGWLGDNKEAYQESISLENHQNKDDWSNFIHFLDILNNSTAGQFRDSILSVFDVEEFLQILAFDIAVNNLDYYANSGRNFYLYDDEGKFHWIPWDYNLTWHNDEGPVNIDPTDYPVLIRRILQVPGFYDSFLRKYCQIKPYFADAFINTMVAEESVPISSYLQDDPFPDYPFEAFQKNLDSAWVQIAGIKPYAAKRYADISKSLEMLNVDCNVSGGKPSSYLNLLQIYPVPATDWVNIGIFPFKQVSISVVNNAGQVVLNTLSFEMGKLNISSLSSGCYVVKADIGDRVFSKLLLVNH